MDIKTTYLGRMWFMRFRAMQRRSVVSRHGEMESLIGDAAFSKHILCLDMLTCRNARGRATIARIKFKTVRKGMASLLLAYFSTTSDPSSAVRACFGGDVSDAVMSGRGSSLDNMMQYAHMVTL